MTILEMMERSNSRETNLSIAFIKDAIVRIQSTYEVVLKNNKQTITKNTRDYSLPTELIALDNVSILDTEDDNKYKIIRRLTDDPIVIDDTSP
jgi:hypothetical protein|tara:strand:- start:567 stop:845 length:279 start_codon:yes stop_codon:yes gene_type:complete